MNRNFDTSVCNECRFNLYEFDTSLMFFKVTELIKPNVYRLYSFWHDVC